MNFLHNQSIFKLASSFFPLFYIKDQGKKTTIVKFSDSKLKIRVNTYDKQAVWEVWKLDSYNGKGFEIEPNDVVVDIGAHIGSFTVWAAKKATKGRILAFEPQSDNFELLRENIKLNKLTNINAFNVAVSDKNGASIFYESDANNLTHSLYKLDVKKKIKVKTLKIESIFKLNRLKRINYLKIDAEGAEYKILLNTPSSLLKKIDRIVIEYHDHIDHGYSYKDLVKFLKRNDFVVQLSHSPIHKHIFKVGMIKAKRV